MEVEDGETVMAVRRFTTIESEHTFAKFNQIQQVVKGDGANFDKLKRKWSNGDVCGSEFADVGGDTQGAAPSGFPERAVTCTNTKGLLSRRTFACLMRGGTHVCLKSCVA